MVATHILVTTLLVGCLVVEGRRPRVVTDTRPPTSDYPTFVEEYITQPVDHFRFGNATWQHRYLVNDQQWTGKGRLPNGCKGPILFYTGNEGAIEGFWYASGFVVSTLAEKWGALVVFGEHRYYGKSMPFGEKSLSADNVVYLSAEQALADYANLITSLKDRLGATNCPVLSFGGSYGGTLTTFFRAKYPHIVAGGLAASAPIGYYDPLHWAEHGVTSYTWIDIVNKVYRDAGCFEQVVSAREAIANTAKTPAGRAALQKKFKMCSLPPNWEDLVYYFTDAIETLPQEDYPYPIHPRPAWPINATCEVFKSSSDLLDAAATVLSWYYPPGEKGCVEQAAGAGGIPGGGPPTLGDFGDSWGYQSCTETLHEFDGRGVRDFDFSMDDVNAACQGWYKVTPRPTWLTLNYGGYALNSNASTVTNVIWSNGLRDPWHGGGFLVQNKESCPVLLMPSGAHHVDLRLPNSTADPADITAVRAQEEAILRKWVLQAARA
eukprot:Sspe_Gene.42458::Locus_20605_Transcript_4_5_Confidence_0.286_Length_1924::g.42458::m.42458/K01285/PRCP; lysosomal Pro-X carboxypeptidase